ncbi:MAG: glycoside hydrolase family 38 C-terminal domain-containing protein [Pseudomonadota bacterium]
MVKVTYQPTPRYENPLAQQLGLGRDDIEREGKLARLLVDLRSKIRTPVEATIDWCVQEADSTGALPLPADWRGWPLLTDRTVWGTTQRHTWLVSEISVPEAAQGKTLVLDMDTNWRSMQGSTDPQCLAYLDGKIAQALDGNHTELVLSPSAVAGETHRVQINAFTFDERPMVGFQSGLWLRDDRAEGLYHDLTTAFEVAIRLPQADGRRHALLDRIERALYATDRRAGQEAAFEASLEEALSIADGIYLDAPQPDQPVISAFGHTHLDVAWLWRVKHVRDKTARSFATVLNLMDEFPDFVFMYNQSVLFHFLKQDYPELWERLKEKVRIGQFEIDGAMWVEPDVNIASGESLIRQIMRGRAFQIDEFGIEPTCVWLPDTFGYSAALPQILVQSGIEFFITSKLSWNDTDRHPYDSFFWRGIDGSRIKSQLITTQSFETTDHRTVYNSAFSVSDILGTWKRYEPKAINDNVMMCFGHGDGGGGPTRDMVQRGLRMERGIPGAPNLRLEGLRPFLARLGERMEAREAAFPTWTGELYLQYHRGTLTSVANNKRNNRRAEFAMLQLEFTATMAHLMAGADYPGDSIRDLWDTVLINQFHDILPGTSIAEVNADTRADYEGFFGLIENAQGPLRMSQNALCPPTPGRFWFINATAQDRAGELVELSGDAASDIGIETHSGTVATQRVHRADGSIRLAAPLADLPCLGWTQARAVAAPAPSATDLSVSETHLENALLRVEFDDAGEILSVLDKSAGRELLKPGARANRLVVYEDKPKNYDAWDIDAYFEEQSWQVSIPVKIDVLEHGPHRAALRIERLYAQSRITQIVSLERGARQIVFDTEVDWQERQSLLKTEFPFDLNSVETRAEIQFGHVRRPTHRNTSWDKARFETSMHRWVDMSEPDFGAALLTDSKYGYDAVEQTIRLTFLKGPVVPDPDADLGVHQFRYALMLHDGEQDLSAVVRAAEAFNAPIAMVGGIDRPSAEASPLPAPFSFVELEGGSVTLETVKAAEDGSGIILRMFEHANKRSTVKLKFAPKVIHADLVDLMENKEFCAVEVSHNTAALSFRPFEIKNLRVTFEKPARLNSNQR